MINRGLTVALIGVALVAGSAEATGSGAAGATVGGRRVEVPPRSITMVAVGDWLAEERFNEAAEAVASDGARLDHVPLLAPVASIISSASLAICHMETPITRPGAPYGYLGRSATGTSLIGAPHEVAGDLRRVGFDRCSTASNHAWDLGAEGVTSTLDALDAAGISHVGTARTATEARPRVFDVEGIRVAHLSFARNSNTGFPPESWWVDRARTADPIVAAVAAVRAAGAEVVIVSLHVFVEMQRAPSAEDRSLVEQVVARSDVDTVVVHGPHVVQPLERVGGVPVFWSLGNFVSGMGTASRGRYADLRTLDGLLAAVVFTERPNGTFVAEAAPVLSCQIADTRLVHPGFERPPASVDDRTRAAIDACRERSLAVVADAR
jgi:poly-gamma-glutamate synthesis protein (capsule biosynthesis protein)